MACSAMAECFTSWSSSSSFMSSSSDSVPSEDSSYSGVGEDVRCGVCGASTGLSTLIFGSDMMMVTSQFNMY